MHPVLQLSIKDRSDLAQALAREAIGFDPTVSFEDGLRATVEWFRKQ